jgi:hypothetical protein
MKNGFMQEHWDDADGNPAGGVSSGCGFTISWQNGPLGTGDTRKAPNGAFVEDVIEAVRGRLDYYQAGGFACVENAHALNHLKLALSYLENRTKSRVAHGVEGTHEKRQEVRYG